MSRLLRQLSPFYRIGGTSPFTYIPNTLYRVQTHGFFDRNKGSQIAAILYGVDHRAITQTHLQINAKSPTEAAWASVALGLAMAIQHKKPVVGIENDNISIIRSLIFIGTSGVGMSRLITIFMKLCAWHWIQNGPVCDGFPAASTGRTIFFINKSCH